MVLGIPSQQTIGVLHSDWCRRVDVRVKPETGVRVEFLGAGAIKVHSSPSFLTPVSYGPLRRCHATIQTVVSESDPVFDAALSPHPEYIALASTPEARAQAYRQLLYETLSDDDLKAIRTHLQQQRALGRDDFQAMVEAKTRRFAGVRPAHRPPREDSNGRK